MHRTGPVRLVWFIPIFCHVSTDVSTLGAGSSTFAGLSRPV